MVINRIDFPMYEVIMYSSIILGAIYIFIMLNKEKISKKNIIIFFVMFFFFSVFFAKLYNLIEHHGKGNLLTIGFTGYGGLIGAIIAALIYGKIFKDNRFFKYTIIALPLVYGFAKLACFFHGCCYGIPYKGPLAVIYPQVMNKSLFPIQLLESIVFVIIFQVCNTLHKNKNIIYITLIIVFVVKFLLDFLRFSHTHELFSHNQIMSIILIIITFIVYIAKRKK
ncbi:MAG: prolipoprotein diacylglyceryl transferase family protein [Bacilli bacterium]|nr:prolipoprotein diacylglyceryl transferase family protein [Bacilli bacterium]